MSAFAARYARALAQVVWEGKLDTSAVQQELEDFAAILGSSKDLEDVLLNPTLPAKKRVVVLQTLSRRMGLGPKVQNFLAVLIEHERLAALGEILKQYRLETDRRLGISDVEIITARRLGDRERADLESRAAGLAGTQVRATFREDRLLIGGVIVRIGSTVYDGSVRGRLDRLKNRLVAD